MIDFILYINHNNLNNQSYKCRCCIAKGATRALFPSLEIVKRVKIVKKKIKKGN